MANGGAAAATQQRRGGRDGAGSSLLARCALFWLSPMLCMATISSSSLGRLTGQGGDGQVDIFAAVVQPLGLVLLVSVATLAADISCGCSGGLLMAQIVVQVLFLLTTFSSSAELPAHGSAASLPAAVQQPQQQMQQLRHPRADMLAVSDSSGRGLASGAEGRHDHGSAVSSLEVEQQPKASAPRNTPEPTPPKASPMLAAAQPRKAESAASPPAAAAEKQADRPAAAVRAEGGGAASKPAALVGNSVAQVDYEKMPERISVVLPCLNESSFSLQTVQSFCERTPNDLLEEIIVVDDGSQPPLQGLLADHVDPQCRLRVLRHDEPRGLMNAKQTGGDAAKGKYIGFYDCHVAPRRGWEEETMRLLKEKTRRLVVPMIGDLNVTLWDEIPGGQLLSKCYINWNAEFWWYDDETEFIPVISGGLVATTRKWWWESGGFDRGMRGWGGENTDQSLRAWLCGGDVVHAKSSIIAHMWRNGNDKRTLAHYTLKGGVDNSARAVAAWFDEFAFKYQGKGPDPSIDVSEELRLKETLGCKPFAYFLHRFRKVYVDGGVLPERVFKIKSRRHHLCIQRKDKGFILWGCQEGTWFHLANMAPEGLPALNEIGSLMSEAEAESQDKTKRVTCGGHQADGCAGCPQGNGASWCHTDCTWVLGQCVPTHHVEQMPKQEPKKCCSGIRQWNSLDCFDDLEAHGPRPSWCDITGGWKEQIYLFDERGIVRHFNGKCLGVDAERQPMGLKPIDCAGDNVDEWDQVEEFMPEETLKYRAALDKYGLTEDMPSH
eukprot:TRINITY_DN38158_c0_g1_i2.p1 TRINITY_DN38158_c0_g1~~TRINITY_DN38158_c0_g1_i2.p1  ORF type:complete len:777 (-),score=190.19 TRINITY_DN38158_c0_g1_i2:756-3086(-)